MRSSVLKVGLRVVATGLVVAGLGVILAGLSNIGTNGSTALSVIGGVVAALGFFVVAHGVGITGWLGPRGAEVGVVASPASRLKPSLYAGGAAILVVAVGTFVGSISTSGSADALVVAGGIVEGVGDLVLAYAVAAVAFFAVGGGLDPSEPPLSPQQRALRIGLLAVAAGFLASSIALFLVAVGFANTLKTVVITGDIINAGGTALVFVGVGVGALGGVVMAPAGAVLAERVNLKAGLLVGGVGFAVQAVGNLLGGISLIGTGSQNVFIAGDVTDGAGLWVTAIGVVIVAALGVSARGAPLAGRPATSPAPGTWGYDPSQTPPHYQPHV